MPQRRKRRKADKSKQVNGRADGEEADEEHGDGEDEVLWAVGDASDEEDDGEDEDVDHDQNPLNQSSNVHRPVIPRRSSRGVGEQTGLVETEQHDDDLPSRPRRKDSMDRRRRSMDPFVDEQEMDEYSGAGGSRSISYQR